MSWWLIALVGLLYLGVALEQAWKYQWGMAIVYVGYALANVGMVMLTRQP